MTQLSNLFPYNSLGFDYVKISDVKAYNAGGGTFTSGDWRTRDINTEDSDASGICTISSNQFTLEAGTYVINANAPASACSLHFARLYNITDGEETFHSPVNYCNNTYDVGGQAFLFGAFTISKQTTFEVQHRSSVTGTFGRYTNTSGWDSIYLIVELFRVKDLSKAMVEMANYVKVSDVKAYNVAGGTFTLGAWRTRDINTEDSDASSICSIASNQITLEAGTYICNISACGYCVGTHTARLYNITDSEVTLFGTTDNSKYLAEAFSSNRSFISGQFTISVPTTFEVQHYCSLTYASYGFGVAGSFADTDSVYTVAEFWRVAT